MLRMHAMVRVNDLDASIRFYSALFGHEPTVRKSDYAKWMLDEPRLNFSIADKPGVDGEVGIEHLGIQAESAEELAVLRERIGKAGGTVDNEGETTCCYANSDKTWVVDAQGVAWEAFYTHGEASTYYPPDGDSASDDDACCDDACCGVAEKQQAQRQAQRETQRGAACCQA